MRCKTTSIGHEHYKHSRLVKKNNFNFPDSEQEDDEAVAGISEHDPEEEGEGDDGEDGRVDLLVAGHAVVVDQDL